MTHDVSSVRVGSSPQGGSFYAECHELDVRPHWEQNADRIDPLRSALGSSHLPSAPVTHRAGGRPVAVRTRHVPQWRPRWAHLDAVRSMECGHHLAS